MPVDNGAIQNAILEAIVSARRPGDDVERSYLPYGDEEHTICDSQMKRHIKTASVSALQVV